MHLKRVIAKQLKMEEVKLGEGYCPYCYNTIEECTCGMEFGDKSEIKFPFSKLKSFISEEVLDELAEQCNPYPSYDKSEMCVAHSHDGFNEGFKAGYCKAVEGGNNDNNGNDQKRVEKLIKNIIKDCVGFENRIVNIGQLDKHATDALTEQDKIARAEERERCIKVAQEIYCRDCGCCYNERMRLEKKQNNCSLLDEVRKAMEGGEG